MNKIFITIILTILSVHVTLAQHPLYTEKRFVSKLDKREFKEIIPNKDGFSRNYISLNPEIFDVDDNDTTRILSYVPAVVCVEGTMKNGKRNGQFAFYLIDSIDHTKRFKIWEQDVIDDQLNGQWKTFDLRGKLVRYRTFKKDSLNGTCKDFWIDGTLQEEREFFNGKQNYNMKKFSRSGKIEEEISFVSGLPHGQGKKYYPNGNLMDEVTLKNGEIDGPRKYYYPSGIVWIEYVYREGKPWNIVANYDEMGKMRNAGTLRNGNGTVILYNDDGSVREIEEYKNGIVKE
jgi:antitoxin component YwqK of YwqJK toxin-antitoxin module